MKQIKDRIDVSELQVGLSIIDPDTCEILFANDAIKKNYGVEHLEGQLCWKTFRHYQTKPCDFCPMMQLKEDGRLYRYIAWRQHNPLTGNVFEHHGALVNWKGRVAYAQQVFRAEGLESLLKQANMDGLCGILNRRAGKEKLQILLEQKKRAGEPFVLALLDVNHLKRVNDAFGHQEGDFLLKTVVSAIIRNLEPEDVFFRHGGDEFIIGFAHKSGAEAQHTLEENKEYVESLQSVYQKAYMISYSFGLSIVSPEQRETLDDLIAKADDNMYQDKLQAIRKSAEKNQLILVRDYRYNPLYLYEALTECTENFIYMGNMKTGVYRYSPAQVAYFDLPGELIENPLSIWKSIVHPQDWERFYEENIQVGEDGKDFHSVEFRARNREGEYVWLRCCGKVIYDELGEADLFAGIMSRISHQQKADYLTNLFFREEMKKSFEKKMGQEGIRTLGVMILDIDHLKIFNEMYGRATGDLIIKQATVLVQSLLEPGMEMFRLEGNQAALLLENKTSEEITELYQKIREKFQQAYDMRRYDFPVRVSAGCAMYPRDAENEAAVMKCADLALQYAKMNGRDRLIVFAKDIQEKKERTLTILKYLQQSVENEFQGFSLQYQMQVCADGQRYSGAEALLRWHCPELGEVSPVEFIPILEESRLIIPVGLWVLQQAIYRCADWNRTFPELTVSVNVSGIQIQESDFILGIKTWLDREHLTGNHIILELTESCIMENDAVVRKNFAALQKMGFQIAMDDFGTGYASLNMLKNIPVDVIKIDRSFVKGIENNSYAKKFIKFIVEICHDIGISAVLEGVETETEWQAVASMDLDYIQGFLFAYPRNAEDVTEQLLQNRADQTETKKI